MLLRCTRKLLAVLKPAQALVTAPPDGEDWYANLIRLGRRQCLLLTHAGTLFSTLEANVTVARLRATTDLVRVVVARELAAEALPAGTFGDLVDLRVRLATTADRAVLGCMNDMTHLCQHAVAAAGGLDAADLVGLNRSLRRNINSSRGFQRPVDLAARRTKSGPR